MNTNIRHALAVLASLSCWIGAQAQEAPPPSSVPDAMEESNSSTTEIPDEAPRVSDIDRLFGDEPAADSADQAEASGRDESIGSPLEDGMSLTEGDLISVDYPNEEIRTVLRNVADLYMINLVVPDTLQGTTSIKLRDVTWRQIFSVVLDPVGYTFVEEGSIIKVVSEEALNFEPPTTEIFMLNYAEASTIAGTVKSLIDEAAGGRVQVDKRTNALIVSERASKMDNLRQVIERLDRPTEQVYIETRFIEVNSSDVKDVGVNWATLQGYGIDAGPYTEDYSRIKERDRVTAMNGLSSLIDSVQTSRLTNAMFSADQLSLVLSALKTDGNSRLISNPTVVTLNNQEAYISVGEKYPLPQYKFNEETGSLTVNGFDYMDIGIILRVRPSVNHNGLISLSVKPEVSSRGLLVQFGDAQVPIINTRVSETQIALKDGYTMGIGGLLQSREAEDTNKVPVLGNIPGVGRLFKHKGSEETQLNLLIFITARVLPSETADFEDVFTEDAMDAAGVDPDALKNR